MIRVLLDTDVILDFFFDRQPFSQYSAQVLSLCESKKLLGYLTPVIYSNLYYLLRQGAGHRKVIEKLNQLSTITDVISMDGSVVKQALNSNFSDFEDALQNYSAAKHGSIDIILTRNLKDFKHSEIGVLTPKSFLKGNTLESYNL